MTAVRPSDPTAGRLRVLVMEDEMMIAFDLEDRLKELGYDVAGPFAEISTGLSIAAELLDFAMLDINLAGLAVYPVARRLRARKIPFAFLSGQESSDLPGEWRGVPVLEKPFSREALEKVVTALSLAARERRHQL
jgi:DNA-binding response OmpR family regulator